MHNKNVELNNVVFIKLYKGGVGMFDLPNDLKINLPKVITVGNKFINIENYISVLEYSKQMIKVSTKLNVLKIEGEDLIIKYITEDDLCIEGKIYSVEYWV
ncbi:sporulation protein YqfC [Tepidibacter thalassicus DSM 15285]|uniref:Sporulation protein YqfC n=2 Tax=Tepidibacter TaxID=214904 RepID=A0A1M5NNJ6_9FIRM|nr:sporulation protein YqfC [Tepidibacter thalassicus DSM 15285]